MSHVDRRNEHKYPCRPENKLPMPMHSWGDDGACMRCGTTFVEHTRGFSSRTSTFEMPPSKNLRHHNRIHREFGGTMLDES